MLFGEGPQIKNIAADLNKLFRQGSLLNQSGQTVEGDSTADQGTRDLLAARDPVIQEISVGMSGEQSARYTVYGTPPLSLPNSLGKPLKAWSVDVLPYQEGSGDPSPINIRPIHGTNKLNLFVEESYDQSATPKAVIDVPPLGKNLFDKTNSIVDAYVDGSTGEFRKGNGFPERSFVSGLIPAGTYTISKVSTSRFRVGIYATVPADRSPCLQYATATPQTATSLTITTAAAGYFAIFAYNGSMETYTPQQIADSIQIEEGSSASSYEAYNATVFNGTIGSLGAVNRWGVVDLGSLNWTYNTTTWPNPIFYAEVSGMRGYATSMCEIYPKASTGISTMEDQHYNQTGNAYLYIRDSNYTSVSDFKSAVSGYKFIYLLETPVNFAIATPDIPTPTGTATTWATAEDGTVDDMEVTYVGKA